MKNYKCLIVVMLIGYLFGSCSIDIKPSELVRYVRNIDHGLLQSKTQGQTKAEVQYKPIPFLIANEFRRNQITEEEYHKRYEELKGSQYYNLKIELPGLEGQNLVNYNIKNEEELQRRLYYLSFGIKNDIQLVEGSDTLRPMICHFERSYDLAPHRTFVLAFEQKEETAMYDKTLILDSSLLSKEPIKLNISSESLQNIPNIKLTK